MIENDRGHQADGPVDLMVKLGEDASFVASRMRTVAGVLAFPSGCGCGPVPGGCTFRRY